MKRELNISKDLAKRKYKIPNGFLYWIYYVIMVKIVLRKFKPKFIKEVDLKDYKGPCFLVWNHLSRIDHGYILGCAYPRKINIVAGYNEFFRSHLHFPFKLMSILPKKNFATDIPGVRAITSIIKKGGCVALSPEGMASNFGYNHPVVVGTGNFIKHFKVPVYFVELKGQYLANTKVCLDERYGRNQATLKLLFSPEDLAKLSGEEIEAKMNLAFKHDDYEWNKTEHIKFDTHGRICENLSDICYLCPKCGSENMKSEKDYIVCLDCNNGARMNDYYEFEPYKDSLIPSSPSEWVNYERMQIIKEIRKDSNYSYSFDIELGKLPNDHYLKNLKTTEIVGEGKMTIDHNGVHYNGTKDGSAWSFDLDYNAIYTWVPVTASDHYGYYINEEFYEFFPKKPNFGKSMLLVEEMHRLHVNKWKNFPWNDYMYENLD